MQNITLGIIGAMASETDGLIERLDNKKINIVGAFKFVEGSLHGKNIVVLKCGIGKVNSASAASCMLTVYKDIKLVINIGVAGGLKKGIKQGDVVIGEKTVQHDFNQSAEGLPLGQVPGFDFICFNCDADAANLMSKVLTDAKKLGNIPNSTSVYTGIIASGDEFVSKKERAEFIRNNFEAYACDMESASINHVCYLFDKKFLSMRAISDGGEDSAIDDFYTFEIKAAKIAIDAIDNFIKVSG